MSSVYFKLTFQDQLWAIIYTSLKSHKWTHPKQLHDGRINPKMLKNPLKIYNSYGLPVTNAHLKIFSPK